MPRSQPPASGQVQYIAVRRAVALITFVLTLAACVQAADGATSRRRRSRPVDLVWHVETVDGKPVDSHQGDEQINPASVVKIATSLWALERLGSDFRYETRFFARGTLDEGRRILFGDLVVLGSGDPDFHAENAFLVAQALNEMGVERVTGALIVNQKFWMGWENGSAGRNRDPVRRAQLMAARLRQGLDPKRWDGATRATWREFAARRGLKASRPPRVAVTGGVGANGAVAQGEMLVVHRSQPLPEILRRFNCYSNNDIERVAVGLGSTEELADMVAARCQAPRQSIQFETTSGLGSNRLTPRIIVRLLREFLQSCKRLGVPVESILPVVGCDPSTVTRFFPLLANGPNTTSVIGKTGTLTNTDGGVAVLAGFAKTASGEYLFCVAVPKAAGKLKGARRAEEQWVIGFLDREGGGQPHRCAPPLSSSDAEVNIILAPGGQAPRVDSPAVPTPPSTAPVK
jgi:serine-type D-Ala-D-Ala carboxypeptidase/endopeptidase (penicillin-binding protein 4)